MEKRTLRRNPFFKWSINPFRKIQNICELSMQIKGMEKEQMDGNKDLYSKVLLSQSEKQVVLTTVNAGTEIEFFQSIKTITIKIISGKVKVRSRKELITLGKGQLIKLFENKSYQMTAYEKTVFLLTTVDVYKQHSLVNIPLN
jgi:quercetin dioxygenase-like cupin family protein